MEVLLKEVFEEDFWIMPQTPQYLESGVPYITSKNIKKGKIDFGNVNYISEEDYQAISKNRPIKKDDILISMIGTLGEAAVVKLEDGKFYGQNMFLVRLDKHKIYDRYFLNYFNSNKVKHDLERSQNQSTQRYLKANHIEDLIIPLPSLEAQRFIAKILDSLSGVVAKRQKELEELDNLIKSRFVEMFGDPVSNQMGWNVVSCKEMASKIGSGATPKGGRESYGTEGISLIRSMNVYNNRFEYKDLAYITDEQAEKLDNVTIEENDVLLNITGASVARCCVVPKDLLPARVNQHVSIIRCKPEILSVFISYMFTDTNYQKLLWSIATSGGATREAITKQQIEELQLIVPPIELQERFAEFVTQVDKLKFMNLNQKYIMQKRGE